MRMPALSIGEFSVQRVLDFEGPFLDPVEFFHDFDPGVLDEARAQGMEIELVQGLIPMSFHSFVLRTKRSVIVIDTCFGNGKERPGRPPGHQARTDYLGNLWRAGLRPEDVDYVMCTHLHWDHVGWNTRLSNGKWVPTFPNARYLIARDEYAYWDDLHRGPARNLHTRAFEDSILPLADAGQLSLVRDDFELEDGVRLESAPGHTPGSIVMHVESRSERGVFSGDVLHSPLQLLRPEWSTKACWDVARSAETRRTFIERHADSGTWVLPAHFPAPSGGRIFSRGGRYGWTNCCPGTCGTSQQT